MRRTLAIVLLTLNMLLCTGLAFAESTVTHITIYNDTNEPLSYHMSGEHTSNGHIMPGNNVYIKDHPVAYYLKEEKHTYKLELVYAYDKKCVYDLFVVNEVNAVGKAIRVAQGYGVEERDVPFWRIDISDGTNDHQVNFYIHVRNQ